MIRGLVDVAAFSWHLRRLMCWARGHHAAALIVCDPPVCGWCYTPTTWDA